MPSLFDLASETLRMDFVVEYLTVGEEPIAGKRVEVYRPFETEDRSSVHFVIHHRTSFMIVDSRNLCLDVHTQPSEEAHGPKDRQSQSVKEINHNDDNDKRITFIVVMWFPTLQLHVSLDGWGSSTILPASEA